MICIKVSSKTATGYRAIHNRVSGYNRVIQYYTHSMTSPPNFQKRGGSEIHEKATRKNLSEMQVWTFSLAARANQNAGLSPFPVVIGGLLPGKVLSYVFELLLAFSCKYEHYASHV